jgi:class 3 adenylate cyclase
MSTFYDLAKAIFNLDYRFVQKSIRVLGYIGFVAHPVYFIFLKFGLGYWESLGLRMASAFLYLGLVLFPKEKDLNGWQKAYYEAVNFSLPVFFTYHLLMNGGNLYWWASMVFAGFYYGFTTKPFLLPVSYPLAVGIASFLFLKQHPEGGALVMETMKAQVVAFFAGIVSCFLKSAMETTHNKIITARLALAKAEEEKNKAEETAKAYEELKKREELIRIYVRPSLVDEIHAGKDPSQFQPVIRNLSIMFCDIREFTRLTEVLSPYEKQTFLNQYFTMMTHPIVKNGGEVDKIMGDCVMGLFPDGAAAVQAAIDMRLELQKFNEGMFRVGSPMIRNGIGIAKGEVMQGNFGSYEKLDRTVIGEAVNIASRLESKTKMYNLEVVVTEDVIKDLRPGTEHYRWIDLVQVKGSTRHLKLYEIYGHQPPEVRQFKDETKDMMEKALTIYFQKGFKDASRLFRAMLEKVPPHRLIPNHLMDNILRYYIAHCDAWILDRNGAWEQIEKWDGVHVFYEK